MATRTFRTLMVAFLVFGLARPAMGAPRLVPRLEVLAATGPKLLVLVAPLDGPARGQAGLLEHAAETAVTAQGRFVLLRSADALDGKAARARQDSAEKARKLDKDGRQKLDDLDAVGGAAMLGDALTAWRASDLTQHFKEFVSTWSVRGGAYATGDENVRARQDIERVLAVAPDAQFSNAYYAPDHLKYAEGLRKQAASATGELTVRSEPPGARIWVDGTYRGVSPATVKGLSNGKHLVTALLAGRSLWQSEVPLGEELIRLEPAEGSVHWTRTLDKISKEPEGAGRDTAARELAAATGAEQVLLVVAKKSVNGNQLELTGLRIEASDGHNASWAQKTVPMDSTEAVDALVVSLLDKDAPREGGKPTTHLQAAGVSSTRKIVGYSVAGAGVVLVITGIIFGGLALGAQDQYRQTAQIDTAAADDIASRGRAFAVVCDVTLITGVVAAAAGAVLGFTTLGQNWFTPAPASAEPEPKQAPPPAEAKKEEERPKAKPEEKKVEKHDEKHDKKADDDAAKKKDEEKKHKAEEERKAKEEEERKKKEDEEAASKKGKKDKKAEAEEKKRKEAEEKKAKEDEKRAKEEEERKKKEEEAARKKADEEARKKADEEAKKKDADKKKDAKKDDEKKAKEEEEKKKAAEEESRKKDEEARKKADDEKKKKEEEEKKKKADEEAKKKAEEEKKKKEAEQKKPEEKKPEDHDDLRNY